MMVVCDILDVHELPHATIAFFYQCIIVYKNVNTFGLTFTHDMVLSSFLFNNNNNTVIQILTVIQN